MLLAGCGSNGSEQPPTLSDDSLYATFRDPGNEWRGKPFWSWNGRLEKDALIRQLQWTRPRGSAWKPICTTRTAGPRAAPEAW